MTTFQITMARPSESEMKLFWKLFRAATRVEDRWHDNTVPFLAEDIANNDLSRAQKQFLFRAWQVLVDGNGGFGRFMGAFDTYVHNFQNASVDYVDLKPSLQELFSDGQILPVVLEAYQEAAAAIPHHNRFKQLSQELAAAKRRITELEHDALRLGSVINTYANRARTQWPIPWPIPARFDYQSDEEYAGAKAMLDECKAAVIAAGIPNEEE